MLINGPMVGKENKEQICDSHISHIKNKPHSECISKKEQSNIVEYSKAWSINCVKATNNAWSSDIHIQINRWNSRSTNTGEENDKIYSGHTWVPQSWVTFPYLLPFLSKLHFQALGIPSKYLPFCTVMPYPPPFPRKKKGTPCQNISPSWIPEYALPPCFCLLSSFSLQSLSSYQNSPLLKALCHPKKYLFPLFLSSPASHPLYCSPLNIFWSSNHHHGRAVDVHHTSMHGASQEASPTSNETPSGSLIKSK